MTYPALSTEQRTALETFAKITGEGWRERLTDHWLNCTEPEVLKPALRQVRNTYGPTWLHTVYAYGWLPESPAYVALDDESGPPQWSAPFPPPAVGERVRVSVNGIGWAVVTGYFTEGGYLGAIVLCEAPPAHFLAQWGGNAPIHTFGAEIKLS